MKPYPIKEVEAAMDDLTSLHYDDTYQPGPPDIADRPDWHGYAAWAIIGGLAAIGALWLAGVL